MLPNLSYSCRCGERELEPFMQCLGYLRCKAASLRHPGRTVLDDVWGFNYKESIHSEYRGIEKQGRPGDIHSFKLDDELLEKMLNLLYMPETE